MPSRPFSCGLDAALAVVGGKWKLLILFHLAHGARRYGELRRAVGDVTDKVLIQQHKELQPTESSIDSTTGRFRRRSNIPSPNLEPRWRAHWRRSGLGVRAYGRGREDSIEPDGFGR